MISFTKVKVMNIIIIINTIYVFNFKKIILNVHNWLYIEQINNGNLFTGYRHPNYAQHQDNCLLLKHYRHSVRETCIPANPWTTLSPPIRAF